jgi:epoxyqueuosine reductase QueG
MDLTEKVKEFCLKAGADIVGVSSVARLEEITPTARKPLALLKSAKSVVAFGVHLLRGVMRGDDLRLKQFNAVEACRICDDIGLRLSYFLEQKGFEALNVHADLPVDFEKPGLMGDLSLRHIAAEAGLGEIGLSTNFICQEYGPRIYLGAVITSAELQPNENNPQPLCDRDACRLCLSACPVGAIREDGTKNHNLCLPEAMPFGLRNTLRHFSRILKETDPTKQGNLIYSPETYNAWQSLLTKIGVFGGCFRCMEVCPIGKKD